MSLPGAPAANGSARDGEASAARSLRPISLPRLLDQAIELSRTRPWRPFVSFALVLVVMNVLFSAASLGPSLAMSRGGGGSLFSGCASILLLFLIIGLLIVVSIVVYTGMAFSATRRVFGGDQSARASWRSVFTPRTVLALIMVVPLSFVGSICGLFLFFLVVPPFLVPAFCALTFPVLAQEQVGASEAIARSFRLAWGPPGVELWRRPLARILGLLLVQWVISLLITLLLQLPYSIVLSIESFREQLGGGVGGGLTPLAWLQVPLAAVTAFVGAWPTYFALVALALLYRDARERLDAQGLDEAITSLERLPAAAEGATPGP